MMKHDYELIAAAIQSARRMPRPDNAIIDAVVREIAIRLWADNPQFDKEKFLLACGNVR